jgi:pyruvate/2-oxoglutarate dehydrogenase complex dihydrolipoamide dehydrogenase (E3) component
VKGNPNVIPADKVLDGTVRLTGKVLIAGGGQIGIETAHLLHEQGLDVTVVEMLGDILMKEEPLTRATIMPVILGSDMQILTDHRIEKVSEHAVTVTDLHTQEAKDLPFDTMVMALGTKPYNPLESAAREAFSDVRVIGDAQATANIAEATKAGFFAGLNI